VDVEFGFSAGAERSTRFFVRRKVAAGRGERNREIVAVAGADTQGPECSARAWIIIVKVPVAVDDVHLPLFVQGVPASLSLNRNFKCAAGFFASEKHGEKARIPLLHRFRQCPALGDFLNGSPITIIGIERCTDARL
jgi:hypothetical protein